MHPGSTDAASGVPEQRPGTMQAAARPTEREAFWFWLKLGFISFGGPAGQIAIMHDELVERRRWIGERRFLHALNFCMALPGPEAQQLASYIGYSLYGVRGAITSGGLFVLPSFVILCAMSAVYVEYGDVTVVEGVVSGLGAAVVALIAAAVLRVGGRVIHTAAAAALALLSFAAILAGVPFPVILVVAALAGWQAGGRDPRLLGRPAAHGDDEDDDQRGPPASARSILSRMWKGLVIWLFPVALLVLAGGLVGELAGFFTLAALVTFGGAYAVLPFVASAAVNHYGWLSSKDMVAGLALGESTPGPLIMVNTFVGFVAGYHVEGNLAWGLVGATVATLATFVPCFVWIITGAPLIDRIRTTGGFANTLNGITIAVVGVIGGLGVFVARHALVSGGHVRWVLSLLAVAAFVAVWRFRVGVIPVIAVCAAVGVAEALIS
ncbi:MAG TPA: chromate efflux transporter [Gaiellales bacterium]|nr:chromate efflux transporter [Gaiellales bacterium]